MNPEQGARGPSGRLQGARLADARLAEDVIAKGRACEALWGHGADPDRALLSSADSLDSANVASLGSVAERFAAFRLAIMAVAAADDPDLRRLSRYAEGLRADFSLRSLVAVLVPFERWAERSWRDDEFLISEGDRGELARDKDLRPLVGVFDNLRSAFNVGSLFRAAECAGCESVWLTGYTPSPNASQAGKTSLGADRLLPWRAVARLEEAAQALKADGFRIVALETSQRGVDLHRIDWPERCALLVGNERFGLGAEALRLADRICRIPMHGRKNSLNVGAAFAVAAFEQRRATVVP